MEKMDGKNDATDELDQQQWNTTQNWEIFKYLWETIWRCRTVGQLLIVRYESLVHNI